MEEFTRKYQPDRTWMNRLKALDPNLDCFFSENIKLMVVTYKRAIGTAVPIMTISNDDQSFRMPNEKDIDFLYESDTQRVPMNERLNIASQYMWDYRKKHDKRCKDEVRDRTKDDKIQLYNGFSRLAGISKGNASFRRITPKQKGVKF